MNKYMLHRNLELALIHNFNNTYAVLKLISTT